MGQYDFYDREDRPWPNARLSQAAIVGHTTETTSRIWVRVKNEGTYWLAVTEQPIETPSATRVDQTHETGPRLRVNDTDIPARLDSRRFENATDRTALFDVQGLSPGTRYYYAVFVDALSEGKPSCVIGRDESHYFRTRDDSRDALSFGLFSCHMPYDKRNLVNMQMWETFHRVLAELDADFVIGGGDQIYADGNSKISIWQWLKKIKEKITDLPPEERREIMTSWYRDLYRGYWGPLDLRRVFRSYPTYMIWDDHEIMDGWGSYTKDELSNHLDSIWEWENQGENLALAEDMFVAAKRVYDEYQHCHNPATRKGQWDYAFEWGQAAFFVLDMRGHRNFERAENRILGEAQLARLLAWFDGPATRNARVLFIVSPVPVVHASEFIVNHMDLNAFGLADDLRDEWEHETNWEERDQILDKVFAVSKADGKRIVFLSGDVHIGAAFKLSRKGFGEAKVYQLTSSAITYYMSEFRRNVLELIVRKNGTLGAPRAVPKEERTTFSLLHILKQNNFGMIQVGRDDAGNTSINWDLYGNAVDEDQIVKLTRINL